MTVGSLGTTYANLALSRLINDILEFAEQVSACLISRIQPTTVGTYPLLLVLLNDGAVKFVHGSTHLGTDWSWSGKNSVDGVG